MQFICRWRRLRQNQFHAQPLTCTMSPLEISALSGTPELPVDTPTPSAPIGSLTRLLQILDLFTLERPVIHIDTVVEAFAIAQSTAYRYLRELSDAGLVASTGRGSYSLGRRIVEFERLLQLSDPLLLGGKAVMDSLEPYCQNRAFLLCAPYRDRVLCIYKVGVNEVLIDGQPIRIMRGRGTSFPLFRGAGSQVILAHMAAHQTKSLYLSNAAEIAAAGLGADWKEFRKALSAIRKREYAETVGRMNPGMYSIAVPIIKNEGRVAGSILMLGAAAEHEAGLANIPVLQAKALEIAASLDELPTEGE